MDNQLRAVILRELNRIEDSVISQAARLTIPQEDTVTVTTDIVGGTIPDDLRQYYEENITRRLLEQYGITGERIMFDYSPDPERRRQRQEAEARKRGRELLVSAVGESAVKAMENGKAYKIKSGIDDRYEYEIAFGKAVLVERNHDILGVKMRPLRWGLCIGPTDGSLNQYDKAYTLITMLRANEREWVKEANFRTASTNDEANEARGQGAAFVEAMRRMNDELTADLTRINRQGKILDWIGGVSIGFVILAMIIGIIVK